MYNQDWNALNWAEIEETVFQVQHKIYLAIKAGDISTARNLQTMLLNMYEPRLLAVKVVTTNKGRNTPGIDKWIPVNNEEKFNIANNLVLDSTTNFIRRVYIPKPGARDVRPLGIPAYIDRSKQCFCKFLLEPEAEAKFESNSFGFRPGKSAIDAVAKIRAHLIFKGPCWVLDTGVRKCFDRIDHNKLLDKMQVHPVLRNQIDAWLRAGIFDKNEIIFPKEGTPQGGIISPLLANIAIEGFQNWMSNQIAVKFGKTVAMQTYYIRYADDIACFAPTQEVILYIQTLLEKWLAYMGLELKKESTRVIYTLLKDPNTGAIKSEHFDFLGFRFKQRYLSKHIAWKEGGKQTCTRTYVLVSPSRIERHKASISNILKGISNAKDLIEELNPRIIGWINYFKHSDAKEYGDLPRKLDIWLNTKLRKWIRRTTKKRGKVPEFWLQNTKDWTFFYKDKEGNDHTLVKYNSVRWSIYDYRAIKAKYSPYSLDYKSLKFKQNPILQSLFPE